MVIKSLSVTAPVKDAEAPLVMVRLFMETETPLIAPPVPASRPRSNAPPPMPAPKMIFAPEADPVMVATLELAPRVTPPEPKLITSPELLIEARTMDAALPVKFNPPSKLKVSPPSPSVTPPELRKLVFVVMEFEVPVNSIL